MNTLPECRALERQLWMRLHAEAVSQLRDCQLVLQLGGQATAAQRAAVLAYSGGSVDLVLSADSPWRAQAEAQEQQQRGAAT